MRRIFRKTQIRTRLLIAFLVVSFFTMYTGLTGVISLTSIGDSAVVSINTVAVLNEMYDNNVYADNSIYYLLRFDDPLIREHLHQVMADRTAKLREFMNEYVKMQVRFSHIFTPGDMQNMCNIALIYNEAYMSILNEVVELHLSGQSEKAISVYEKRLDPIYCLIFYSVSNAFDKVFQSTTNVITHNNQNARVNAFFMWLLILGSLIASVILAFMVTKSISEPLTEVKNTAKKMAGGNLDIQFEDSGSRDEIAHLASSLNKTVRQLKQVQQLKMEAMETRLGKEQAEAVSRSKSQFLARMSHEIRTPMNAIIGMTELALREGLPGAAREQVQTIKQASASLLAIINDILDISKIESGKLEIIPGDYEFSLMINEVINIIKIKLMETSLKFEVDLDPQINYELFGDEIRIRQILLNILSNAVKYTERGRITLKVRGEPAGGEGVINLVIEVSDTGKGIKKADLGKLFGDFVQVDAESNKGIEGTGLGLAITKSLVKAMDGSISVESEYGRGSTFKVVIPQKIRSARKLSDVSEGVGCAGGEEPVIKFTAPEAKVMVVDDINTNLQVAVGLLSPYGVRVKTCKSGAEAVETVGKEEFDVVFMDHMMPDMDGIETTLRIREMAGGRFKNLPIVAMTANAVSGMREMYLQQGLNDYLTKPIDLVRLNAVLEKWIPKDKQKALTEGIAAVAPLPQKENAGLESQIVIPGINVKKGVMYMGGDMMNYSQALGTFREDGSEKIVKMREALEDGDLKLYTTHVHALKSALANIGAETLSDVAKILEMAGMDENRASIDALNAKFTADLEMLLIGIDSCLNAAYDKTRGDDVDAGAVKAELAKLKAAIDGMDIDTISDMMESLKRFAVGAGTGAAVSNILRKALVGEYDEAVGLIDKLL